MEITREQQLYDKLKFARERNNALYQQVQELQGMHHFTLECLKNVMERLNRGEDRKGIASDIKQYIDDLGGGGVDG